MIAVMQAGRVVQIDPPEEVVNHPADEFVASFVGENNVFAGRVVSAENGFGQFDTEFGRFKARLGPGVSQGSSARLYVRPERSTLSATATGGNEVSVEVMELTFEGNFVNVLTRDEKGYLHMVQVQNDPGSKPVAPGTRMRLAFQPADGVVLGEARQRSVA